MSQTAFNSKHTDEGENETKRIKMSTLHKNLTVPVTCKIRRFESVDKTIRYAKMLVDAGCQMLTVHGRMREQKGPLTGLADWSYIKAVRENVAVPIFANGNILSIEDIDRCLSETSANGVMTAEGNLHNPAIFERGYTPLTWTMAYEYLDIVEEYPCPTAYIRGHLFKIFHHLLNLKRNVAIRQVIAISHTVPEFRRAIDQLCAAFEPFHNGTETYVEEDGDNGATKDYNLSLPPWICQPYIRMEPDEHIKLLAVKQKLAEDPARVRQEYFDDDGRKISRKLMKRLLRTSRRPNAHGLRRKEERSVPLCSRIEDCDNPMGIKCAHELCRVCCRDKCYTENVQCVGHKFSLRKINRKTNLQIGVEESVVAVSESIIS